jgi:hypothetical protein
MLFKMIVFQFSSYQKNEKTHVPFLWTTLLLLLYNKIEFEIDTNNDELLETIWEHMREKKGKGGIIKLINLHLFYHYS